MIATLKKVQAVLMDWATDRHDFRCEGLAKNEKCPHERCKDALVVIESAKNHVRGKK